MVTETQKKQPKVVAKKTAVKSDLIRKMLTQELSVAEIRRKLKKKGIGVYPSEIYRLRMQ